MRLTQSECSWNIYFWNQNLFSNNHFLALFEVLISNILITQTEILLKEGPSKIREEIRFNYIRICIYIPEAHNLAKFLLFQLIVSKMFVPRYFHKGKIISIFDEKYHQVNGPMIDIPYKILILKTIVIMRQHTIHAVPANDEWAIMHNEKVNGWTTKK